MMLARSPEGSADRWVAGLGLLLLLFSSSCSRSESSAAIDLAGGRVDVMGRLVSRTPAADFGAVFEGAVLKQRFTLAVEGQGPVAIEHVKKSCGCTTADLVLANGGESYELGQPLQPGTELWLDTTFETLGRPGQQTKPIGLYGEFHGGVIELALKADVHRLLVSEPELSDLGQVLSSNSGRGEIELRLAEDFEQASSVFLELDADLLEAQLELDLEPIDPRPDGSSDRFRLQVATRIGLAPGYRNYRIPLRAQLAGEGRDPEAGGANYSGEAIVRAHILGLAEARPLSLSLGSLKAGQVSAAAGRISVYGEVPDLAQLVPTVHVTSGDRDVTEFFTVEIEPVAAAQGESGPVGQAPELAAYSITVRTDGLPGDVRGLIRGRIVLDLDREAQPELVIGLQATSLGG